MTATFAQQLGSNYYGNVWLALATLAYTDDNTKIISHVGADLLARVQALGQIPGPASNSPAVAGTWNLDWGPYYTQKSNVLNDNANLMYVVSYRRSATDTTVPPWFVAICIRGTDTSELYSLGGLITQLAQDLDVNNMVEWQQILNDVNGAGSNTVPAVPSPSQPAIARGSWLGLTDLLSMPSTLSNPLSGAPSGTIGVQEYVQYLATNPAMAGVPIIVTGHSLGGCQATVVAQYFANMFPAATIIPHPFAPPSAGNAAWAQLYQNTFPANGQVWWNTADIVPNAFQNKPEQAGAAPAVTASLSNILNMWGPDYGGNLPIDNVDSAAVVHYQAVGATYVQLANSMPAASVQQLTGAYMKPVPNQSGKNCSDDWLTQLMLQHFPPMYGYLMNKYLGSTIAAFAIPPENNAPATCTVPNGGQSG